MSAPRNWQSYPEELFNILQIPDEQMPFRFDPCATEREAKALRMQIYYWGRALSLDPSQGYNYGRFMELEFTLDGATLVVGLRKNKLMFKALERVTKNPLYTQKRIDAEEMLQTHRATIGPQLKPKRSNVEQSDKLLAEIYKVGTAEAQTQLREAIATTPTTQTEPDLELLAKRERERIATEEYHRKRAERQAQRKAEERQRTREAEQQTNTSTSTTLDKDNSNGTPTTI